MDRASIIGHSMGGASAIAATAFTDRFKASVILDGWLYPIERDLYRLCNGRPTLMLNASKWQWAENVSIRPIDSACLISPFLFSGETNAQT